MKIYNSIDELYSDMETEDIYFMYAGEQCHIETTVIDSQPIYNLRFGDLFKDYSDFKAMSADKVFGGKSLYEILPEISIRFT